MYLCVKRHMTPHNLAEAANAPCNKLPVGPHDISPELEPAAKQKNQKSTTCTLHYLAKQKDPGGCRTTAKSRAPCVWRPRVQMFGSSHHRRVRPLAGFGYASEPTAECIRSFPDVPFVGCEWYHVVRWLFWGCNLQKIFMFSSR